uniref:Uncharacterized protein n=1 Tax=Onchocerca volvulus TaxID=6282 RepID=A0A8R1XNV8_ONCVO
MIRQETRKKNSPLYLTRRNLQCLLNTDEKTIEQAVELEEKKAISGIKLRKNHGMISRQKSRIKKQVIVIDGTISKTNKMEIEWKESLHSAKDGEWGNDVKLYEDYVYEENSVFDTGNKICSKRALLLMKLNRINEALKEIKKKKCEMRDNESASEGKRKA